MAICRQYGISHSHFLGGPPSWTDEDRDKAAAYEELLRQTCGTCGTRPEEWDPDKGGSLRAYEAESRVCMGCVVRERAEATIDSVQRGQKLILRKT